MKEVTAIIRMDKMNRTKQALTDSGISAFVAHEAFGRGLGLVNGKVLEGASAGVEEAVELLGAKDRLYPKRMLTVVVPDDQVDTVVQSIITSNQTGKPGDGKIFVQPVLDSTRVRTGETGQKAIV